MFLKQRIYDSIHIVADIETMDTAETAVVLSIGLRRVRFSDTQGKFIVFGPVFYLNLVGTVFEQLLKGRTISESTIKWWASPDQDEPRKMLLTENGDSRDYSPITLAAAEDLLQSTLQDWILTGPAMLWGFGSGFDCNKLDSLTPVFREQGVTFRGHMCERTLSNLLDVPWPEYAGGALPKHHASRDASHQAEHLANLLSKLHEADENIRDE